MINFRLIISAFALIALVSHQSGLEARTTRVYHDESIKAVKMAQKAAADAQAKSQAALSAARADLAAAQDALVAVRSTCDLASIQHEAASSLN